MNILPLSLFCLCLCCGFSRGGQPPEGAPVRFRINMDQAAGNKAPSTGPVPDQSTPLNAAKLLLRALQEKTDWKHEPYKSLPATSPFVSQLRLKSILSRMEAVQGYVTGAAPERPPFVDEDSIIAEGDLAMAYILLPDKANPYVYAATAVALVKKEGQWKASLTPGSFDNTFLPFEDGIREKAKKISSEAKKKIFGLAHQYSVAAVKAALEHIKRFRQENVRGTTDDELKNLLIRAVKGDDPALIAALLVSPYYTESAITQSARLIPVVKAMRLQDRREENRYIQPTHLSFMTFPNTILVPLSPHPDDQMAPNSREEDQQEEANKNNAKKNGKDIHSIGAMTILPPRMSMPDIDKPALIYRYALEKTKDPTDGLPVFKMNLTDAFASWNLKPDESTTARIMADFHRTYPPLSFPTPEEAVTAAGRALANRDSLAMMRMLAPSNFASVKEFEDALSQLKTVMGRIPTPHTGVREKDVPEVKAAYIPAARDGCAGIKATIGVRTAVGNEFSVNNLHFIQTDGGWMLAGADAEQPLELEAPKAP
ncbi:hypothetical protein [Akkermansia muciniphila]|uniref:hypothetical protein n=1 Tax=Akkermansia muciniphila TaxID=239935 RepID=UPI0027D2DD95|nr:hypothetical protein [Akkermansia muciniphila]MCC8125054.1 hypothetical protein [Akkermansia sp.]MCI9266919.1 hypothetical protein [Akkermansia muciniphila]WMB17085.1 hypothetical protein O4G21_09305 [Akkermansia muciniphila]